MELKRSARASGSRFRRRVPVSLLMALVLLASLVGSSQAGAPKAKPAPYLSDLKTIEKPAVDAKGWAPPARLPAKGDKPAMRLVEWDPDTSATHYIVESVPDPGDTEPVFIGIYSGITPISECGQPFENIRKSAGYGQSGYGEPCHPVGTITSYGITVHEYDDLDYVTRRAKPGGGGKAYVTIHHTGEPPNQEWRVVGCPAPYNGRGFGGCQNLWGEYLPVTEVYGNVDPPSRNTDHAIRLNGQLKELPYPFGIRHVQATGESQTRHYLPLFRGLAPWYASMGIEVRYGADYPVNLRSNYIFFGTNGRIISLYDGGTPEAPETFTLMDLGLPPADHYRVRHFKEGPVDYVEMETLFTALGATRVALGTDAITEVDLHPELDISGWYQSCVNHLVQDPGACPTDKFAFNMLIPYWRQVTEKMGITDPELVSPISYYSLLTRVYEMDPTHVGNPSWELGLVNLNHEAIKYEAADYSVWEKMNADATSAVVIAIGVWEGVEFLNWTSQFYPDPARMHRSAQALERELEDQALLGAAFADDIRQALRSHGLDHDLPIVVAPYKVADVPDGPAIVARHAPKGSGARGGLAQQSIANGSPFGEVPGMPDWVYNVESFTNGVAVDGLATVRGMPNLPFIYLTDSKIGYQFMFISKDFKQGIDPKWAGIMDGKIKGGLARLIDAAKYMRRTTGNANYKVAIYHPDKDFVTWFEHRSIELLGEDARQFVDFYHSPDGKATQFFDLVNFTSPPGRPAPIPISPSPVRPYPGTPGIPRPVEPHPIESVPDTAPVADSWREG